MAIAKAARGAKRGTRRFNEKFDDERQSKIVNILPKNDAQADFIEVLKDCDIAIARGSAGTGKTFLAATWAANEYLRRSNLKIYLSRPYVPMGRTAGMLPGTIEEKMMPFLAPLVGVLKSHLGDKFEADFGKNIQIQLVEAIRGIDLEDAILLVDEAQNLTKDEMKSIVTRLGKGAKIIFTGDTKQSDLKKGESGLDWLCYMVEKYNIKGVDWVDFRPEDIVRSGIVRQFVMAFDKEGDA